MNGVVVMHSSGVSMIAKSKGDFCEFEGNKLRHIDWCFST